MALLIQPDGTEQTVTPHDLAEGFSLIEMYFLLDCDTIQVVAVAGDQLMVVDENGKIKARPRNRTATVLLHQAGGLGDWVAGPALICNRKEFK